MWLGQAAQGSQGLWPWSGRGAGQEKSTTPLHWGQREELWPAGKTGGVLPQSLLAAWDFLGEKHKGPGEETRETELGPGPSMLAACPCSRPISSLGLGLRMHTVGAPGTLAKRLRGQGEPHALERSFQTRPLKAPIPWMEVEVGWSLGLLGCARRMEAMGRPRAGPGQAVKPGLGLPWWEGQVLAGYRAATEETEPMLGARSHLLQVTSWA